MTERREPTPEDKRLILTAHAILYGLEEFRFGYEGLLQHERTDDHGSVGLRYHVAALMHYLASWFLLDKDEKKNPRGGYIDGKLASFGVDSEIATVYHALDAPVGMSTIGEVIRSQRNAVLVHPKTLVPGELMAQAENRFGADHESLSTDLPTQFHEVCAAIGRLEIAVRVRLPEPLWPPDSRPPR